LHYFTKFLKFTDVCVYGYDTEKYALPVLM